MLIVYVYCKPVYFWCFVICYPLYYSVTFYGDSDKEIMNKAIKKRWKKCLSFGNFRVFIFHFSNHLSSCPAPNCLTCFENMYVGVLETKCILQHTTSHNVVEQLKFSDRDQTHCGIRGPGGRAEDSRSVDPGFKSRNWAKFQSCGETLN